MIRQPVTISLETYTTILDKENLGDPHPTLVGGQYWYPPELVRDRDVRVLSELREQGLADGSRLSEQFRDTVRILQRPTVEYYTYYAAARASQQTVRTALLGRDALLITSDGAQIQLEPIPHEQLGVRVAATLPETQKAHIQSINCAVEDLDALHAGKSLPSGHATSAAKRMQRWLDLQRHHVGQLFAAVRDNSGVRRATQAPMPCWIDTDSGRMLLTPDGTGWCTLRGADLMTIAEKLSDLEQAVRR